MFQAFNDKEISVYVCMRGTKVLWLFYSHLEAPEHHSLVEKTPLNHKNIHM
jgi:hypothetical protein